MTRVDGTDPTYAPRARPEEEAAGEDARVGVVAVVLSKVYGGRPERSISAAVDVVAALDGMAGDA